MIYIDPPYNTGNDSFVYPDDYSETLDQYQKRTGEKNAAGHLNKQSLWKKNSKESGQYHSAWLSMMYPRLYLARNLLRDDGVIFISIDDNEAANLKLLCDEVFGEENAISLSLVISNPRGRQSDTYVATVHDSLLIYGKNINVTNVNGMLLTEEQRAEFKYVDSNNEPYRLLGLRQRGAASKRTERPDMYFPIYVCPETLTVALNKRDGWHEVLPRKSDGSDGRWMWGKEKCINDGNLLVARLIERRSEYDIFVKDYLNKLGEERTRKYKSVWDKNAYNNQAGTQEVKSILNADVMSFPKPKQLLIDICNMGASKNDIILDFFAGSGTTAQAAMELNLEDGGNRQCICVQMPEVLEESSEAYKAGYRSIADITRARIAKVIAKLKTEQPDKTTDLACANFTLAPSNFKVWRSEVTDATALREQLALFQSTEKDVSPPSTSSGRTTDAQTAMLAELLLKHGLGALGVHAITRPLTVAGVTVHRVLMRDDATLWLCFGPYAEDLKDEIVKAQPAQVILLNSCFVGDKADELLANLQLELAGLDIGLTVI
jgi:adenine-specific DNA-methyltransferase